MPDLLLEILSEEIPARMQAQAGRDLERLAREQLAAAGLDVGSLRAYAGPRRLTLVGEGLPAATPDQREELKGPKASAPDQALQGFLRKTGLSREQLVERDGVLFATIDRPGRPTPEIVAQMVETVVRGFPWPKSMRWGSGSLRWVRPIRRILCTFGGEVVPLEIDGVASGDVTEGHRFLGDGTPIQARTFGDYAAGLERGFVVLDAEARKARIVEGARRVTAERGLELVEDIGLLEEVSGLAEWPTPILGDMDPSFLDLPPEVIRTSMRTHQKYFAVRGKQTAGDKNTLAPHFVAVANIEASDGGKAMAAGYARVLSARLNDARFFWDEDKKRSFDEWLDKLKGVTFHAKLGTLAERAERLSAAARQIAPLVGADPAKAAEAGRLAKADLASGMVGEFPELQGIMGGYYAREKGMDADVARAIRGHYRPQGPGDAVPRQPVTIAVALADKLDVLLSFFEIDERPTGSKDPFALRRAALGVIRLVLENGLRAPLRQAIDARFKTDPPGFRRGLDGASAQDHAWAPRERVNALVGDLLAFFADRLKVVLREQGKRHDLVDAVFALGDDDLVRIVARVEALDGFLATDDGANLLAGYRRAVNILKAESKKTGERFDGGAIGMSGAPDEERALMQALSDVRTEVNARLSGEDFAGAMQSLAELRGPVDRFFDRVLVNDPEPAVRRNRLQLLAEVRAAMNRVADFSLISG
jgi:glycyl-tRNA synthetase beta chain